MALGRIRDDDLKSVEDARVLLDFRLEVPELPQGWQGQGFPSSTEEEVDAAYRVAFPERASRLAINHGYVTMMNDGIHGRETIIKDLSGALGLTKTES